MNYLRAAVFYSVFVTANIIHSVLSLLVSPFLPFPARFRFVCSVNRLSLWWLRLVCGIRYEVIGREHLPSGGPFVILANHQSEWETLFLQLLISPQCTVLKKELLRIPFFGWALALLKPIAIDRSQRARAMKQILQQGKARLAEGIPVLIFPQGTRVPAGEVGKFNKGGAMLACSAEVPIVTIVHNAGEHWPSGRFPKTPGTIQVRVGPVIDTQGRKVDEVHQETTRWLQHHLEQQHPVAARPEGEKAHL
ncbi:1-acyl-sn-glycerol-3-phosphate acyltransferase [Motiliproteus sp. SC1-56]|uniref:lysophospholipid acyltransferase family protein n=1 Tax=Motiliproteus sp. SC1-56 TaxID=2799565 RepID=UPI001F5D8F88|nr:lysophospholipid acyltransferase family protein [Motiliproteus sp. SC1-56]